MTNWESGVLARRRIVRVAVVLSVLAAMFSGVLMHSRPGSALSFFSDSFDPAPLPGWTLSDNGAGTLWEVGDPLGFGPGICHSPPNCYGTNLLNPYTDDASLYLTTSAIVLPVTTQGTTLKFWHWYDIEFDSDGGFVEINDGLGWTVIDPIPAYPTTLNGANVEGRTNGAYGGFTFGWEEAVFDITSYEGSTVNIRFGFVSDFFITYAGWYVDDVLVETPTFRMEPNLATEYGSPGTTVRYRMNITNNQSISDTFDLGSSSLLGWSVEFWNALNTALLGDTGGSPSPDSGPLAAGGVLTFYVHILIPGGAVPADQETTNISATSVANSLDVDNSTLTTIVPFPAPWSTDLESGTIGWTMTGFWHLVDDLVDPCTVGSASPTHSFGYHMDLSCNYDTFSFNEGRLTTPPVDISMAITANLSFSHYVDISPFASLLWVELSTDGGQSWVPISPGYYSTTGGWVAELIDVTPYVGNVVLIGFQFVTFGFDDAYPGWFIDDVEVNQTTVAVGARITPSAQSLPAVPGGTVDFSFTVRNIGTSGPDLFDLTYNSPSGWSGAFFYPDGTTLLGNAGGSPAPDTGTLASGETFDLIFRASVPAGATGPETYNLTANSSVNPSTGDHANATAAAPRLIVSPWAALTPTIDGALSTGEWSDAWQEDLLLNVTGNPLEGYILVKNDASFLYVAIDGSGDGTNDLDDAASLAFDTDNDGVETNGADDQFAIGGPSWVPSETGHWVYNSLFGTWILEDSPFDTAMVNHTGLAGARGFGPSDLNSSVHRTYEFAIPLNLIDVAPGDLLGFFLGSNPAPGFLDNPTFQFDTWPVYGFPFLPDFGDLRLASIPSDTVSVTTTDVAPSNSPQGASDVEVLLLNFSVSGPGGSSTLGGLTLRELGTSLDGDIASVRLLEDVDSSGTITAPDLSLGSEEMLLAGVVSFSLAVPLSSGTTSILVVLNLTNVATSESTIIVTLQDESDVSVSFPDVVAPFVGVGSGPTTILDATPPSTTVNPLPTFQTVRSFSVSWTATDNAGGSGINKTSLYQRAGGGSWILAGTYAASPQTVVVSSDGLFEYYAISQDVAGNWESPPSSAQAFTWIDATAPSVILTSPGNQTTNVPRTSTVAITFSEAMNATSVQNGLTVTGGVTPTGFSWNAAGTRLTFSASPPFQNDTYCTVTVPSSAKDVAGNAMGVPYQFSFKTIDSIPPAIAHTPVTSARVGQTIQISVQASDNEGVETITAFYRGIGATSFASLSLTLTSGTAKSGTWTAILPAQSAAGTLEYYLSATDTVSTVTLPATAPSTSPYETQITAPVGAITGTVVDEAGKPVEGATVRVLGTNLTATTNASGRFTIASIPAGTYQVAISKAGFNDRTISGVDVSDGEQELISPVLIRKPSEAGLSILVVALATLVIILAILLLLLLFLLLRRKKPAPAPFVMTPGPAELSPPPVTPPPMGPPETP